MPVAVQGDLVPRLDDRRRLLGPALDLFSHEEEGGDRPR